MLSCSNLQLNYLQISTRDFNRFVVIMHTRVTVYERGKMGENNFVRVYIKSFKNKKLSLALSAS